MRRLILPAFALACLLVAPTATHAAAAKPPAPGAVVLKGALVKPWGVTRCGLFAKQWRPGTVLARGYFVSHAQQSLNFRRLALRSRGRLAVSHRAKALRFARLTRAQQGQCNVPRGALKLRNPTAQLAIRSGVSCLKVGSQPGIRFGTYFATHVLQAREANLLSRVTKGAVQRHFRAENARFNRLQNTQKSLCSSTGGGTTTTPTATPVPLRFNIGSARGLALRSSQPGTFAMSRSGSPSPEVVANTSGSNLTAVEDDGSTHDAISSGKAVISRFLTSPTGKVYVLFQQRVDLANSMAYTMGGCLLAEVDVAGGTPTCIDSDLMSVNWATGVSNPAIQFDASGAIYYAGRLQDGRGVLRRYAGGTAQSLITDYVTIGDFMVQPDGSVFITGTTTTTMAGWVRKRLPTGGLIPIHNTVAQFMKLFPDGNLYTGLWGGSTMGIYGHDVANQSTFAAPWTSMSPGSTNEAATTSICGQEPRPQGFCGWYGAYARAMFSNGGEVYAIAGAAGLESNFMQYFPAVSKPTTMVTQPTLGAAAGSKVVLAGQNASNQHIMSLYDLQSDTEKELIAPANQLEVYHLDADSTGQRVLFDGQRFSDGAYVFGSVDIATGTVTVMGNAGQRWEDYQALG